MDTTFSTTLNSQQAAGLLAGMGIVFLIVGVAAYLFFAFCIKKIADKTGHGDKSWWAFIPILNYLLLLEIAGKPMWWIVLLVIPFVNIVIGIMVMMEVAKACGKEPLWGIIAILVPIVGFPYLAFSDSGPAPAISNTPSM